MLGETTEISRETDICTDAVPCAPAAVAVPCLTSSCACGCNPCQCQQSSVAAPLPFYNQAPACQESHTQILVNQNFVTALLTGYAFNMPVCGEQISVSLPGVQQLQVGGYLWNSVFGYLRIVSFDYAQARAIVENECQVGNAAPGTEVPSCTLFNVVDPPFEPGGECGEGSFLTVDFVAPANGASVNISVTNLIGLTLGSVVQVSTGAYTITAILSANYITIKNNGLGVLPGTTVSAYDALGHCITPITSYSANPCSKVVVDTGALVVCHGGVAAPLNAVSVGQIPVCINLVTNEVEFQTIAIPTEVCTYLTAGFNLIAGTTTYTLVVDDNSEFAVGDLINVEDPVNSVNLITWEVTNINPDTVHMTIHDLSAQVLNYSVPVDISVCHVPCCEQLDYELSQAMVICDQDWSSAQKTDVQLVWEADEPAPASFIVLAAGDPPFNSDLKTINFSNDTCNPMQVLLTVDYIVQMGFDVNEFDWARIAMTPYTGLTTAAIPGVPAGPGLVALRALYDEKTFGIGNGGAANNNYTSLHHIQYHHTEVITIPANTNLRYDARLAFDYLLYKAASSSACPCAGLGTLGSGNCELTDVNTFIHAIGVAVQAA